MAKTKKSGSSTARPESDRICNVVVESTSRAHVTGRDPAAHAATLQLVNDL